MVPGSRCWSILRLPPTSTASVMWASSSVIIRTCRERETASLCRPLTSLCYLLVFDGGVKFEPALVTITQQNTTQCGHCWGLKALYVRVRARMCVCECVCWQNVIGWRVRGGRGYKALNHIPNCSKWLGRLSCKICGEWHLCCCGFGSRCVRSEHITEEHLWHPLPTTRQVTEDKLWCPFWNVCRKVQNTDGSVCSCSWGTPLFILRPLRFIMGPFGGPQPLGWEPLNYKTSKGC